MAHHGNNSKTFGDLINERLRRWSFDREVQFALPHTSSLELEGVDDLVLERLELPVSDRDNFDTSHIYPRRALDEKLIAEIAAWDAGWVQKLCLKEHKDSDPREVLRRLVEEEVAFVVSEYRSKHDRVGSVIAFATAAMSPDDDSKIEIGRLLVHPERRQRGIGQTTLSNLANLISVVAKSKSIFACAHRENGEAIDMLNDMRRFVEFQGLATSNASESDRCHVPEDLHIWYRWDSAADTKTSVSFGDIYRRLRLERKLTQQIVAQRAGMTREAVNAIEHHGTVSPESARRLLDSLTLTRDLTALEKLDLVFSAIGTEVPKSIILPSPLDGSSVSGLQESRWTLSDRPLELVDDDELEHTVEALIHGYTRYFFIPAAGVAAPYGVPLIQRIIERIRARLGHSLAAGRALNGLRLYTGPSGLCRLRMVVFGPESERGKVSSPRGISIAGPSGERIALDSSQVTRLFDDLCDSIRTSLIAKPLELNSRLILKDGFELIPLCEIESQAIATSGRAPVAVSLANAHQ